VEARTEYVLGIGIGTSGISAAVAIDDEYATVETFEIPPDGASMRLFAARTEYRQTQSLLSTAKELDPLVLMAAMTDIRDSARWRYGQELTVAVACPESWAEERRDALSTTCRVVFGQDVVLDLHPTAGETGAFAARDVATRALGAQIEVRQAAEAEGPRTVKVASPQLLDERVEFSVYRPVSVIRANWASLLVFAHRSDIAIDPQSEVRPARSWVDDRPELYRPSAPDPSQSLVRGDELVFVPWIEGGEIDPPHATFRWVEAVHGIEFRFRVPEGVDGQTAVHGGMQVFLGVLLIGEVRFSAGLNESEESDGGSLVRVPVTRFRRIFPSYSTVDREVVKSVEAAFATLGDTYLRDVEVFRSDEQWAPRLRETIESADVFQLFWSSHSMASAQVRAEYETALSLRREGFVRPVFWEDPRPADPGSGLPPAELVSLPWTRLTVRRGRPIPDLPWLQSGQRNSLAPQSSWPATGGGSPQSFRRGRRILTGVSAVAAVCILLMLLSGWPVDWRDVLASAPSGDALRSTSDRVVPLAGARAALTPDGSTIVVAIPGGIRVIPTANPESARSVTVAGDITGTAVSPDSRTVYLAATNPPAVVFVDVATWLERQRIVLPSPPNAVSVAPDGSAIAVAMPHLNLVARYEPSGGLIAADVVRVEPDWVWLVDSTTAVLAQSEVPVLATSTGVDHAPLVGGVRAIAVRSSGAAQTYAVATDAGMMTVERPGPAWKAGPATDVASSLPAAGSPDGDAVVALRWSVDGDMLYEVDADGRVSRVDPRSTERRVVGQASSSPMDLLLSPDRRAAYVLSVEGTLEIVDLTS
jgi:hypothetical protein